jgi:two-component system cell cycle response regulator
LPADKILIVDDDKFNLELIGTYIDSFGYEYDVAEDGEEAVQKLQEGNFTIVLTDMIMPRMDGMQLLKYIQEYNPKIGVIVVTGHSKTFTYTALIKAGASDFISKPFNVDELEAKLNRIIRELNLVRQLEQYSIIDVLTGLYNRRYFDNKILEEVQRADRQRYSVFLQMIDVDNLKGHNDEAGHQSGDKLLHKVGVILAESIRANVDWPFRYGGDEFGIISTQVEFNQIIRIAERILIRYNLKNLTGTGLSIGIARFIRRPDKSWHEDVADLVARADKALYSAKNHGKNQVSFDESSCLTLEV